MSAKRENNSLVNQVMKYCMSTLPREKFGIILFPETPLLNVSTHKSLFDDPVLPWVPERLFPHKKDFCVFGCDCEPTTSRYLTRKLECVDCTPVIMYTQYTCKKSKKTFNTLSEEFISRLPDLQVMRARQKFWLTRSGAYSRKLMDDVHQRICSPKGLNKIHSDLQKKRSRRYFELLKITIEQNKGTKSAPCGSFNYNQYMSEHKPPSTQTLQDAWLESTKPYAFLASALMRDSEVQSHILIDSSRKFTKQLQMFDPSTGRYSNAPGAHLLILGLNEIYQIIGRRFIGEESNDEQLSFLRGIISRFVCDSELEAESVDKNAQTLREQRAAGTLMNADIVDTDAPLPQESDPHSRSNASCASSSASESSSSSDETQSGGDDFKFSSHAAPSDDSVETMVVGNVPSLLENHTAEQKTIYLVSDSVNNCQTIIRELSKTLALHNIIIAAKQDPFHIIKRFSKKIKTKHVQKRMKKDLSEALLDPSTGELRSKADMILKVQTAYQSVNLSHINHDYKKEWEGTFRNTIKQIQRGDLTLENCDSNIRTENGIETKRVSSSPLESVYSILKDSILRRVSYPVGMRILDFAIIDININQGVKFGRIPDIFGCDLLDLCQISVCLSIHHVSVSSLPISPQQYDYAMRIVNLSEDGIFPWRKQSVDSKKYL